MSFPSFEDIDKTIKDLLNKDFFNPKKAPYQLKTKAGGPCGSKLTHTLDFQALGSGFNSSVSAECKVSDGFSFDKIEIASKDGKTKVETSLTGGPVPSGLKVEFKGDSANQGELGATFESDAVTAEGTFDVIGFKSASLAFCSGTGPMTFGASANISLDGKAPALGDAKIGATYSVDNVCSGGLVFNTSNNSADVTLGYSALPDISLGALINYPSNNVAFGGSYACNANTIMKGKANTSGVLDFSVKQTIAPKCVLIGQASVDSASKTPSFGANLTIG